MPKSVSVIENSVSSEENAPGHDLEGLARLHDEYALAPVCMTLYLRRTASFSLDDDTAEQWLAEWSCQKPGPNADAAKDGIGPDAEKRKTYARTYAKGQVTANGIVLLYGAGQVWPHVLGDFRLSVPAAVFAKYLAPQWKTLFGAATR